MAIVKKIVNIVRGIIMDAARPQLETVEVLRFEFRDDGLSVIPNHYPIQIGPEIKDMIRIKASAFPTLNGGGLVIDECVFEGDTKHLIQIDVSMIENHTVGAQRLVDEYLMGGSGKDVTLVLAVDDVKRPGKKIFTKLCGSDEIAATIMLRADTRRFGGKNGGQIVSPSTIKKGIATLLENSDPAAIRANFKKHSYEFTELVMGEELLVPDFAKVASRGANWTNCMIQSGEVIRCHAIYFGNWNGKKGDGICWTTKVRLGLYAQIRAFTAKGLSVGLSRKIMKLIVTFFDANPIVVDKNKMDDNTMKEIAAAIRCKGKGTRFEGRVLVIADGDNATPELFMDMNTVKAPYDVRRDCDINAINIFGDIEDDGIKMSGQVAIKQAYENYDGAMKYYCDRHASMLDSIYALESNKLPAAERLAVDNMVPRNTLDLDPEACKKYFWIAQKLADDAAKQDRKVFNEFKVDEEGKHRVIVPDFADVFGFRRIIQDDEYFTSEDETGTRADIVRYPSPDLKEIRTMAVSVGSEVLNHIRYIDDVDMAWVIRELIVNIPADVMMVPATEYAASLHGGWDFDGDSVNARYNDGNGDQYGFDNDDPIAIVCDMPGAGKTAHKIRFGLDFMGQYGKLIWGFGNLPVGVVADMFSCLQKVRLDQNFALFEKICVEVYGNSGRGKKAYQQQLFVETDAAGRKFIAIDMLKVNRIFMQLHTMALTKENFLAAMDDLNRGVGRFFLEMTIDSGKKFYPVVIPMAGKLKQYVLDGLKTDIRLVTDWEAGKVKLSGGATKNMKGRLEAINVAMAKDGARKLQQIVSEIKEYPDTLPQEIRDWADQCWTTPDISDDFRTAVGTLVSAMYAAGSIYKDFDKKDEDAQKSANKLFGIMMRSIENEYRKLVDTDNAYRIGLLLGAYTSGAKQFNGVLRYLGTKICAPEFYEFVAQFSAREGAMDVVKEADLDKSVDETLTAFKISASDAVYGRRIKAAYELLRQEDTVVELVDTTYVDKRGVERPNTGLKINGELIPMLNVHTGGSIARNKMLVGRVGTVESIFMDKTGQYTQMLVSIRG